MKGYIQAYFSKKGYGFVCVENDRDYFFHVKAWRGRNLPVLGEIVHFTVEPSCVFGKPALAVDVYPQAEVPATPAAPASAPLTPEALKVLEGAQNEF